MPEPEKTTEEAQTTTPKLEDLMAQLQNVNKELEQTKKGLSTAHQTITEKDKELKRRLGIEQTISGLEERMDLLATAIATGARPDDAGLEENKQSVLNALQQKRREQEVRKRQDAEAEAQNEFTRRADEIYGRAETIYGEDEDALYNIRSLIRAGDFDLAERKINKAAKAKEQPPVDKDKSKETEEQKIERLANEKMQKFLEDRGLLTTETNITGSSAATSQQAMERYIKGKITASEAKKLGAKFD